MLIANLPIDNNSTSTPNDIQMAKWLFKPKEEQPIIPIKTSSPTILTGIGTASKYAALGVLIFFLLTLPPVTSMLEKFSKGSVATTRIIQATLFFILFIVLSKLLL